MEGNIDKKLLKISSVETNSTIDVSIENNGSKIPDEALARIFDKFYSSKLGNKKSGLGLSIVKNIISEHDAEIKVSSSEFSTIFVVSFNKKRNE